VTAESVARTRDGVASDVRRPYTTAVPASNPFFVVIVVSVSLSLAHLRPGEQNKQKKKKDGGSSRRAAPPRSVTCFASACRLSWASTRTFLSPPSSLASSTRVFLQLSLSHKHVHTNTYMHTQTRTHTHTHTRTYHPTCILNMLNTQTRTHKGQTIRSFLLPSSHHAS
jgi:hypothetical protein